MQEIKALEKSVRDLLAKKYTVDSYQREYKWGETQIADLVNDLTNAFTKYYQVGHKLENVAEYGQYFLGPIIVSEESDQRYIVDGQQRLTSLTLVLIALLHLTVNKDQETQLRNLIYSSRYGERYFNLYVPERTKCLDELYTGKPPDSDVKSESVLNLIVRYEQIQDMLASDISEEQVPLFVDWLIERVCLVEIKTTSNNYAYEIFETMNDRGLNLMPTEMLKSYLLSEIRDKNTRDTANKSWKNNIDNMVALGKAEDSSAIKAWLRGKYAKNSDHFDEIGSQFHRWVRNQKQNLQLQSEKSFSDFIQIDFDFYAKRFLQLRNAASNFDAKLDLHEIYYLAQHNFTLQYTILLAALSPTDSESVIQKKLRVIAAYLDIMIHRRIGNGRKIAESTMRDRIIDVIVEVRNKDVTEIADFLNTRVEEEKNDAMNTILAPEFALHGTNRKQIHRILARITDYMEIKSNMPHRYSDYFQTRTKSFQIEHIWHANYEKVCKEESINPNDLSEDDFERMRNQIGGLLLLPLKDNASYGDKPYAEKREYYQTQNLLAGSLHKNTYDAKTGFRQFVDQSQLPFEPSAKFQKENLEKRQKLYRAIADEIWHPRRLHEAAGNGN